MRRQLAWHALQAMEGLTVLCAGTWEGIQAAKQLEEQGVATHIILVYRYLLSPFGSSDASCLQPPSTSKAMYW